MNRSKLRVIGPMGKPSRSARRLRPRNPRSPELKAVAHRSEPAGDAGEVDGVAAAECASKRSPRRLHPSEFLERQSRSLRR
jgi:hypothetical protein